MSAHLARYLKDFSVAQPPVGALDLDMSQTGDLDDGFPALIQPDPVDIEAERQQAYAEGHETASAELTARFAVERAELEAAHAAEIARLRDEQSARFAAALNDGLRRVARSVAATVSDEVAAGLAPFLSEEVAVHAIEELARRLETAILAGESGTIVIKGPTDLFERLKQAMPEHGDNLRHVQAEDLDLSVDIADTVLVTRISAWTASLRKVMG